LGKGVGDIGRWGVNYARPYKKDSVEFGSNLVVSTVISDPPQ